MDENKVIAECRIIPPDGWGDTAKIMVKYEGEEEEKHLYSYFTDELSFRSGQFVGLTKEEAHRKIHDADVAYLRS